MLLPILRKKFQTWSAFANPLDLCDQHFLLNLNFLGTHSCVLWWTFHSFWKSLFWNTLIGQTLHSCFGFKFGNKFISLSERRACEKRATFENLKVVIIDEISMVPADLLYNLDLKLREITMQHDKLMGGVSIFALGDLYQLQPVNGHYVFEEPSN